MPTYFHATALQGASVGIQTMAKPQLFDEKRFAAVPVPTNSGKKEEEKEEARVPCKGDVSRADGRGFVKGCRDEEEVAALEMSMAGVSLEEKKKKGGGEKKEQEQALGQQQRLSGRDRQGVE
jgi:hypothetical protein